MTLLGKLLVLFNLAFSILLMAWAFEFWANGIDWTNNKGGEYAIHAEKLDEMWKGVKPAESSWLMERGKLTKTEASLIADRKWYDTELRYVYAGPAKDKFIREVAVAKQDDPKAGIKKADILLDDQGFPLLVPPKDGKNNPLQLLSLAEYNKEDDATLAAMQDVIALHLKQIDKAIEYTDLIIGTKESRGYLDRIADERLRNDHLKEEIERIKPMYINTMVEAQLINKRHAQMEKRIEELKKLKVASK